MDVIFDIDGTLANANHRLHFINDTNYWVNGKPNWAEFLRDDFTALDAPIEQTWKVLNNHLYSGDQVIFITGRNERCRQMTMDWLLDEKCSFRWHHAAYRKRNRHLAPWLFMRPLDDRRPSEEVKRDSLQKAQEFGFKPTLVYEDRASDTHMWREQGLLCCQVAEGNY